MSDEFESELLAWLREKGEVTFAELVDRFPRVLGQSPMVGPHTKVIIWPDLMDWAIEAIVTLGGEEKLFLAMVDPEVYPRDRWLRWEVAKVGRHYKTPRWLPMTLCRDRPDAPRANVLGKFPRDPH